jgi:hypothetical protein
MFTHTNIYIYLYIHTYIHIGLLKSFDELHSNVIGRRAFLTCIYIFTPIHHSIILEYVCVYIYVYLHSGLLKSFDELHSNVIGRRAFLIACNR